MLEKFIEEASNIDADTFSAMVRACTNILSYERSKSIDAARIDHGLIELERDAIVLIGDLHGDLEALVSILRKSHFLDSNNTLIFLGDYGDRGYESVEVYSLILNLKIRFPERIILLRGNHEYPSLPFAPHDLPLMLNKKFGNKSYKIYEELKMLFDLMYNAVIKDRYIILHGGLPINLTSRRDLALADKSMLEQILWNDPKDNLKGFLPSLRGYGYFFGKDVTLNGLKATDTSMLIRAHEPCNGYKMNHDGLVLTIFSCKVPYGNSEGAYLVIDKTPPDKLLNNIEFF